MDTDEFDPYKRNEKPAGGRSLNLRGLPSRGSGKEKLFLDFNMKSPTKVNLPSPQEENLASCDMPEAGRKEHRSYVSSVPRHVNTSEDKRIAKRGDVEPKTKGSQSENAYKISEASVKGTFVAVQSNGTLNIKGEMYDYSAEDLLDEGEIGRGCYGTVNRMVHKESTTTMAVKRIRATVDEPSQKQLLKELEIVMNSGDCPNIVTFYGALFKEGDCWICMELMATSVEKVYKHAHHILNEFVPEEIIGQVAVSVVEALNFLKTKLGIIHRDVKPSNMLLDYDGSTKLCDFGISGQLVDSIARTRDAGCKPYMAPERIDPKSARQGYDIRSDVWSLGIALIEIATGDFPYPKWNSIFEQLSQVIDNDPPQLPDLTNVKFSINCKDFVQKCLTKDVKNRPKYGALLEHPFVRENAQKKVIVAQWLKSISERSPLPLAKDLEALQL